MVQNYFSKLFIAVTTLLISAICINAQVSFPYQSSFKYLKGSDAVNLSTEWVNPDFDDTAWNTGNAPFRYGDGVGGTELTDMKGNYSTIFLRTTFTASQVSLIENVMLNADWDDGFVMFVNGKEVVRRQAPEIISYDALSIGLHEHGDVETIIISKFNIDLIEGENTLAVFACNTTLSESSDFYIDLSLNATPTQPDMPEYIDTVGVAFSKESGFYFANFTLQLTSPDATANIVYTLDGSNPQTSPTSITATSTAQVNIDPESNKNRGTTPGVVVRASVVKDGFKPSKSNSKTYLFLDQVRYQSYPGWDWPSTNIMGLAPGQNGEPEQKIDLDVDADVINIEKSNFEDALLDIPTISVVTDNANLFNASTGIYVNALMQGREWERECSVELINPDGSEGFNVNAGLRIRGGWSRHGNYPKHAFRLFFRSEYGNPKLNYPLFGDEGVDHFDKVDLRCSQNYSWANSSGQHNTFIREVFLRDAQGETGSPYTRSRYYHLYLNGLYWGLFQTQERSEARYASDYLGGKNEDWDILKIGGVYDKNIVPTDGNLSKWREVWNITESGFQNNSNYFKLEGLNSKGRPMKDSEILVDIDNLIDYMINIFYSGNFDSPISIWGHNNSPNNLYIIKDRTNKTKGFQFLVHDAEHTMMLNPETGNSNTLGIDENRVNLGYRNDDFRMTNPSFDRFHTQWLHHKLSENEEYRVRFADLAVKRLTNNGIFTKNANIERLNKRAKQIQSAIIAESARWGDTRHDPAYKKTDWENELNVLRTQYFPRRTQIVINQLEEYDLFPAVDAPTLKLNGTKVFEEYINISSEVSLTIEANVDEIYYTINGTDPRAIGGDLSPSAIQIASGESITTSKSAVIKIRAVKGDNWSAIREVNLVANQHNFDHFKVTELHYHPTDSIIGTDTVSGKDYEFIEFKNTSYTDAINLSGVSIDSAVRYTFDENTLLPPQQFIILSARPKKFYDRYGLLSDGNFKKSFSNSGERVLITNKFGDAIMDFTYSDLEPWPSLADGQGSSLTSIESNPTGDPNDFAYWVASADIHGSPKNGGFATDIYEQQANNLIESFKVYPNPTNNIFNVINYGEQTGSFKLMLYDVNGRLLLDKDCYNKTQISLNKLGINYGVYMVRIESANNTSTQKMIYKP